MDKQNQQVLDPWEPKSLKREEEREARKAMLAEPHVAPLAALAERIRAEGQGRTVPDFEPLDGGVDARALFLLEAPGPKAVESGFVSMNNPDESAKTTIGIVREAGLDRKDLAYWNIVPWYVGSGTKIRPVEKADLKEATGYLAELLSLMTKLEVVVLVGNKARDGFYAARTDIAKSIKGPLPFLVAETMLPSPQVIHTNPANRAKIMDAYRKLSAYLKARSIQALGAVRGT